MRLIAFALLSTVLTLSANAEANIAGHWTFEAVVEADC